MGAETMPLSSIESAIEDIRAGKMVIIVDDEDRENEGDLAMAAEKVTPEAINFMASHGRGLICVPLKAERLKQLQLPMMVQDNTARLGTAFTVSVDVLKGATTGISAFDRSATVRALIDPETDPDDLGKPGHIFPLRYQDGGVLVRAGQTEAVVDLANLAGLQPAGILCEIMAPDGTMARMPALEEFSAEHGVRIVTVADLIAYRRTHEKLVDRVAEARLPTRYGEFSAFSYSSTVDKAEHVAPRDGRGVARQADAGAGTQRVPDERRVRKRPVRLRGPGGAGAPGDRPGGPGRVPVHAAGGARHRHTQQAAGLLAAGRRPGHRGRKRPPRLRGGRAPLRRGRADSG